MGWGLLPFVNPPEGFLVRVGKWEPLIIKNKPQTSAYVARKLSVEMSVNKTSGLLESPKVPLLHFGAKCARIVRKLD